MRLFVVIPCHNEEETIGKTVRRVSLTLADRRAVHTWKKELILVDDGSSDRTWELISTIRSEDPELSIHGIRFARNFGHQAAICAGLDFVRSRFSLEDGDTVLIMDADGQHPAELIPSLLEGRAKGYHHVQMLRQNETGGWLKRVLSPLFYRLFRRLSGLKLPNGASDFRAVSGLFLKQYLKFNESVRFNRGLFQWMGFETLYIPYVAPDREAGETSYTALRMFRLALEGLTYFSSKPLIVSIGLTTMFGFLFCIGYALYELISLFLGATYAPGWPTLVFFVTLWGSLISLGQLMLAIYVSRVFDETKRRPLYIVENERHAAEAIAYSTAETDGSADLKAL